MSNKIENKREQFGSKAGFILACIGSAIGMGNIWMFPWRVGKYGGAAFLIPYLIFVLILGTTGLVTEFSLGRMMKSGSLGAFEKIFKDKKKPGGTFFGAIPVVGISFIAIGYAIVVGWVLKYQSISVTGALTTIEAGPYFGGFVTSYQPIFWHFLAMALVIGLLSGGVANGIEKVNKIIMPSFFVLFIILMIRSVTLPGAQAGIEYLLIPDWSYLQQPITWVMALGQAFFTVSLGGAGMVVYGSYINDDHDIPVSAIYTSVFDTLGALIAAFVVIPPIFAFGLDPAAGPPLLFISLPMVFQQMPFGHVFSILFFISILFAAISSLLNLVETPLEAIMGKFNLSRKKSGIIVGVLFFLIGIIMDLNIIDLGAWMDFASVYLLPTGAMLAAITLYWVYGADDALTEINKGAKIHMGSKFKFLGKYVYVFTVAAIIILGIRLGAIG
jgi:NSS family neurotransmitter:Na+ symporter